MDFPADRGQGHQGLIETVEYRPAFNGGKADCPNDDDGKECGGDVEKPSSHRRRGEGRKNSPQRRREILGLSAVNPSSLPRLNEVLWPDRQLANALAVRGEDSVRYGGRDSRRA